MYTCFYLGKRWEFVWGEGSRSYSEEVIKTFICKHGSMIQRRFNLQQLGLNKLAAIHAGARSSTRSRAYAQFGAKVANLTRFSKLRLLVTVFMHNFTI